MTTLADLRLDAKIEFDSASNIKEAQGTLSHAHSWPHVRQVAGYAKSAARAFARAQGHYDEVDLWGDLAELAAWVHDIEKVTGYVKSHGLKAAAYMENSKEKEPWSFLDDTQFEAVHDAIKYHSEPYSALKEQHPTPFGPKESMLSSVIAYSLWIADDVIEGSGYAAIYRGGYYTGKIRLEQDLTMFSTNEFYLAILGETMHGLYKRNPIKDHPGWLKSISDSCLSIQYRLYIGLLEYAKRDEELKQKIGEDISESTIAEYMLNMRFPGFDSRLCEEIRTSSHLNDGYFDKNEYPSIANEIETLNGLQEDELRDLGISSHKIIEQFAVPDDPEDVIADYKKGAFATENKYYHEFMAGIIKSRDIDDSSPYLIKFEDKLAGAINEAGV